MTMTTRMIVSARAEQYLLESFFGNVHRSEHQEDGLGEVQEREEAGRADVSLDQVPPHSPIGSSDITPDFPLSYQLHAYAHRVENDEVSQSSETSPARHLAFDP